MLINESKTEKEREEYCSTGDNVVDEHLLALAEIIFSVWQKNQSKNRNDDDEK